MMKYTPERHEEERSLALRLSFECNFLDVSYETAKKVCNGIGASWFPSKLNEFISGMNPSLVPVADNHDLGYYFGIGTRDDFHKLNIAFKLNGVKVAKDKYSWYDPRRYYVEWQAAKFAALCDAFGWIAYTQAMEDRKIDREAMLAETTA